MSKILRYQDAVRGTVRPLALNPARWGWLDGMPRRFNVMIWGEKSSKKSTLGGSLIDDLSRIGPALEVMSEEDPRSGAMARRGQFAKIIGRKLDLLVTTNFEDVEPAIGPYEFILIDSVTLLGRTKDFIELAQAHPDKSFIFIYQTLQDVKVPRDGIRMEFFCGIVVHCSQGIARTDRNRYGEYPREHKI